MLNLEITTFKIGGIQKFLVEVYMEAALLFASLTVSSTWTPTLAMASPFSWPVLVPSALRAPAPVN
jgi:hypothetical protein